MRTSCVLAAVIVLPANPVFSTTWDEPWQDQVLKSAESFARYEVLENAGGQLVLKKIRHLAGKETPEKVVLDDYYMLETVSSSSMSSELEIEREKGEVLYCFLKKAEKGEAWRLPTPTAGFAKVMAVWGLKRQDARDSAERLKKLQETASTEEVGFESNIMDPRIGTRFPDSVKAAIQELLEEWTGKKNEPPAEGKGSTE
jgi:hypothetical protein